MKDKIQILIVEDHTLLREGMVSILEKEPGFEVVGQGASAEEAINLSRQHHADLFLMDMDLPVDGVALAHNIATFDPVTRFLFLTISNPNDCSVRDLLTGERAYILQNVASQDFFRIMKAICYNENYLSPALAASLLCESSIDEGVGRSARRKNRDCKAELTRLEQHILKDLASELSIPEIGLELHLPERIIKQSIARILRKRRVHSRFEESIVSRCGQIVNDESILAIEIGRRQN